jgi:hypothetical protein
MNRALRKLIQAGLALAMAAALCACGSTGAENAALLNQPLRGGKARVKIVRAEEFAAGARGARVKVDGKQVADLGGGGSTVLDVAAGSHDVVVDIWDHPNVYKLKLQAKPGMLYTLEVTARDQAVVAGMFGVAGMLAEAAANENGGVFQIRVVSEKPIAS